MYDYFEAFSIIPYRLATNGQFATTWTKKTPMHKRTVKGLIVPIYARVARYVTHDLILGTDFFTGKWCHN